MKIYGTMYYVKNMSESIKFMKENLGLTECTESPDWSEFTLGENKLCFHLAKEKEIHTNGILIFNVDSVSTISKKFKEKGVSIIQDMVEVYPGNFVVDFKDPSGNLFSVYGPK